MPRKESQLLIFTKNPIPGKVKTRIGNVKGHDVALKVYKNLLKHTSAITEPLEKVSLKVFFNESIEGDEIWSSDIYKKALQVEGNLGMKMSDAIKNALVDSEKVVLIGSDCAALSTTHLKEAFEKLDHYDIVIGPAEDGGYYLIGMKEFHREIFENMPWSEDHLLEETHNKIESLQLNPYYLEKLSDIDFWEDWEKLNWPLD